jgi:predicted acetyltransferase
MASMHMQIEAERARMAFLDDPGQVGRGRFVDAEEALKVLPDIYNRVMRTTPGMMGRSDAWWEHHRLRDPERIRGGASHMWRIVYELDGRPEGYALYRVHSDWPDGNPRGKVQVNEAMATSAVATRELWRFLFGIDLIDTIKCDFMPIDHPLQLMLADPRRMSKRFGDSLWIRIIDVKKALEQRSYAAPDALNLEIADDLFPENSGTWRLDTGGDSVSVTRTDADADLSLHVRDLAALYLGGHTGGALTLAGRLQGDEPDVARLDAIFSTPKAPWCPEIF